MIFLDTSFLGALLIENGDQHNRALKILDKLHDETNFINITVFTETINAFKNQGGKVSQEMINAILEATELIYLSSEDYNNSLNLFLHYGSRINFSDCTILNTMFKLGINEIVSFDSDFDKVNNIKRIH